MQKKPMLELMLLSVLLIITASVCIATAQPRGILEGMQIPGSEDVQGVHQGSMQDEGIQGGQRVGPQSGQQRVMPGSQQRVMSDHYQPPGHFQPQDRFRRDNYQQDRHQRDHFRRDHEHYPEGYYWPGGYGYVLYESWPCGYGPGFPIGWPIAGFLNPPSNLAVVSSYPCTIPMER
jgi:hypothetical protein